MVASEITSLTIVYSTVYSDTDQRKHQSPASLAIVRGIQMFPFDDVAMYRVCIPFPCVSIWYLHSAELIAGPEDNNFIALPYQWAPQIVNIDGSQKVALFWGNTVKFSHPGANVITNKPPNHFIYGSMNGLFSCTETMLCIITSA